jgi:putative sigma-54 modulation protein
VNGIGEPRIRISITEPIDKGTHGIERRQYASCTLRHTALCGRIVRFTVSLQRIPSEPDFSPGDVTMRLEIRSKHFRLHAADREVMECRIQFALGHFSGRISSVIVGLADLNGPRRGIDKQCRLVVRLPHSGNIIIEETHANVAAAVALAADRAGRAVGRELRRRRDVRHDHRSNHSSPNGPEPAHRVRAELG